MSDARGDYPTLHGLAASFASDLDATLRGVLPADPVPLTVERSDDPDPSVLIEQAPTAGIPLSVDGEVVLRLQTIFRCAWDRSRRFAAVRQSSVSVLVDGTREPLFR
ncbi:hypothetical protein [Cellulomonas sp. Marseille-Q8402]